MSNSSSISESVREGGGFDSGIDSVSGGDNIDSQFDSIYNSRRRFLEDDQYDEDFSWEEEEEEFSDSDASADDTDNDNVHSNRPYETDEPMEYYYDDNYDDEGDEKTLRDPKKQDDDYLKPMPQQSPPPSQRNPSQNYSDVIPNANAVKATTLTPPTSIAAFADVKAVFPDFEPGSVLRFSKLFKKDGGPSVWTDFSKQRSKRRKPNSNRSVKPESEATANENGFWRVEYEGDPSTKMTTTSTTIHERLEAEVMQAYSELDSIFMNDEWRRKNESLGKKENSWSNCPGKLWYDLIDEGVETSEFSFKLKTEVEVDKMKETEPLSSKSLLKSLKNQNDRGNPYFPAQSYEMVTQRKWENQVIWDSSCEIETVTKNRLKSWVPRPSHLCLPQMKGAMGFVPSTCIPTSWDAFSVLPIENPELVHKKWEDDVMWDVKKVSMKRKIKPKILTLDPNDDNIIVHFPKDTPMPTNSVKKTITKSIARFPHAKKSKLLLRKAGLLHYSTELNELNEEEDSSINLDDQKTIDPYNISNDEYYQCPPSKRIKLAGCSNGDALHLDHAIPVMELQAPFIPTKLIGNPEAEDLRRFHRPLWNWEFNRNSNKAVPIQLAGGNQERFSIQTAEDLSAKDGEVLLIEYCEEHPPLLSQVGMCSKIKNYYGRKKDASLAPSMKYGETTEVSQSQPSPFLGRILPGQMMSSVENKMYRAPIYSHQNSSSDFLLILDKNKKKPSCFIREFGTVFTAGQQIALQEVPSPKSKVANNNNFVLKFLEIAVRHLFKNKLRRVRLEDVKRVFPSFSERTLRKLLLKCAVYHRGGSCKGWWYLRPRFKPRIEDQNQARVKMSPEDCCTYLSLLAGQQRLKNAGYADADENEEEVKAAPWNTTRACLLALKGKGLLELSGSADPTGCGEAFSYVRQSQKKPEPVENGNQQDDKKQMGKLRQLVGGTDADLRKLSVVKGRAVLRKYKMIGENEIVKLNRFEIIDLIRTLSTVKANGENDYDNEKTLTKFSRRTEASVAKAKEKKLYNDECQRIFELQNKVLSSSEVLSSDEGESGDEELKEMAREVEGILVRDKRQEKSSYHHDNQEEEEKERKELVKMVIEGAKGGENKKEKVRVLKITRTFKNQRNGNKFTKTERVRNPEVIDAYLKLKAEKIQDESVPTRISISMKRLIENQLRMEKRRLQDKLRRIKKYEEGKNKLEKVLPPPPPPKRKLPELNVRCSKCGEKGHIKSNKNCRLYRSEKLRVKLNGKVGVIRITGLTKQSSSTPSPPKAVERNRVVDSDNYSKIVLRRSNRLIGKRVRWNPDDFY